jgi:uncharacterized membrane protein YbaN (DUF454 family)
MSDNTLARHKCCGDGETMMLTEAVAPSSNERESQVRNVPAAGTVRVEVAALFSSGDDAHIHDLISRLFRLQVVQAIDVDRGHCTIEIRFDSTIHRAENALRLFAEALERPHSEFSLGESLERLPGPVRSVERRRASSQALAGRNGQSAAGFPSAAPVAESGSITHENRVAKPAADQTIIILEPEDIIISYDLPDPLLPAMARFGSPARWPRIVNLILGGVSFVMSIVGILTPLVPTMPFVLATGYFLALASPRLNEMFRRSPLFGEMLCDWEEFGGWRLRTKLKLFALMALVWGVTLAIVGVSPALVISMGLVSSISVIVILRVATVSDERTAARLVPATA